MLPVRYEAKIIESGFTVFNQSNACTNPTDTYRLESIDAGLATTTCPITNPILVKEAKVRVASRNKRRRLRTCLPPKYRCAIQNSATEAAIENGNCSPST